VLDLPWAVGGAGGPRFGVEANGPSATRAMGAALGNRIFCCGRVCPKVSMHTACVEQDFYEDLHICDPAGAIFRETLEDLNEMDRLLLTFASSSNLTAVRWLTILGANINACDINGTTCLNTSCRSGSLAIVRDLINCGLPVATTDVAGWTPLHVAVFMGRRAVALHLMRNGAELHVPNYRGVTPIDLCTDVWLREAIGACAEHRNSGGSSSSWVFGEEHDVAEDVQVSSRLRFEPFFVPRTPVLKANPRCTGMQKIGIDIFNGRPGQGLAFLVATGTVRDFPIELSSFLMEQHVSLTQVGEFLGEDFSLSQTLRLEFINSVRLTSTGVVSCLGKVFNQFHIPTDMQKIDRLVDGIAQIWWRQHEQMMNSSTVTDAELPEDGEVVGFQLMALLAGYGSLHQLMFSTVMLHWNLYAPLPPSQRVTLDKWLRINADISGVDDVDPVMKRNTTQMLTLIYNKMASTFLPQLQMWSQRPENPAAARAEMSGIGSGGVTLPAESDDEREDTLSGWGRLLSGGFPSPAGISGTITYKHIRSILSETTTAGTTMATPNSSRAEHVVDPPNSSPGSQEILDDLDEAGPMKPQGAVFTEALHAADLGGADVVWLSLREQKLLFAPKAQDWAPYAFLPLSEAVLFSVKEATLTLKLEMDVTAPGGEDGGDAGNGATFTPIQLIFLLPDGRWQVIEVPCVAIQLPDLQQLRQWSAGLAPHCTCDGVPSVLRGGASCA